ncbi:malectin domain-containing carbohydrate-binding protein [Hymenobacter jejuensis]|nr:malectin domain-containing carbohydrate-binding protein [Hymenobacter jejuensis]
MVTLIRTFVVASSLSLRAGCMGLALPLFLTISTAGTVQAQGPTPISWSPARNAPSAPRTTAVAVSFNQALSNTFATQQALVVFGSQAGGLKSGTPSVSGNTLTFRPTTPFKPGETVFATVTTGVQNSSQQNLARPYAYQFTAATARGTGLFRSNPDVPLSNPASLAVGDLDGDGDLDLVSVNAVSTGPSNTVSVRLNAGNGTFTGGQEVPGIGPGKILLGDLDGDHDLDLVTSGGVRLNNGGTFGNPEPAGLGGAALSDVDGDGDLDLLTEGQTTTTPTSSTVVRVRLNNGHGGFSESSAVPVSPNASTIVVGDVNNDGAPDLLASGSNGFIDVRLNTGRGMFASTGQQLTIATMQGGLLLGDVDGDGDLDLVAANTGSTVTVVLNDGQGTFSGSRFVNLGSFAVFAALGDVDGDGDLDLLAGGFPNSVSLRRNDGLGNFSGDQTFVVPDSPRAIAVGDLDGDGTLDFATANSSSGTTGSASIRLNQAEASLAARYRINAGGGALTTSLGAFAADQFYAPAPGSTYATSAAIAGTTDDALYQTERFGTNGVMGYALPVVNGTYIVKLHFAELYWSAADQRVFDVSVEGNKVLTAYDIFRRVGANTATTESFPVTVSDGTLNLDFSSLNTGGKDNPKVSAIEILSTTATAPPVANAGPDQTITLPTSSVTLAGSGTAAGGGSIKSYAWAQVSGPATATFSSSTAQNPTVSGLATAGTYVFSLVVTDNQDIPSPADQVQITVNPDPTGPPTAVYRINAGGGALTTSLGAFAADQAFSPSPGNTYATGAAIAGTTDDALYQTERFGTNGTFAYALPVANGTYTVKLHFAELYWNAAGQRVFDVSLEGNKVLTAYDIFQKVGANTAAVETFSTSVTDGVLNLDFTSLNAGGRDNPKVAAIEILAGPGSNPAPTAYHLNAGGGALSTSLGAFAADQAYAPAPGSTYATSAPIANTNDDALYQTERFGTNGTFAYALPIANGSYAVTLHFAELYWTAVGQRVFDVNLENAQVLTAYDIYKKVGANTATTETFTVSVADGVLNLDFSSLNAGGKDNPKVAAIEVVPSTAVVGRPVALGPGEAAAGLQVFEAYPNPFAERATIRFRTTKTGPAQLHVYNALGQRVATLFEGVAEVGHDYEQNLSGTNLPAGVYTCRLLLNGNGHTQRLLLVK